MKTPLTPETREAVLLRDWGSCRWCFIGWDLEIHHRQGRGGANPNRMSNLLLLCRVHHKQATENPAWAFETGLSVRRIGLDQTDEVPYADHEGHMWALTDDGQRIHLPVIAGGPS